MKAKSREINIFNMSLLDILTGSLGAFLFLMLGMMPTYVKHSNTPVDAPPAQSEIADLKKQNAELRDQLRQAGKGDVKNAEVSKMQGELSRLKTENEDLKKELPDRGLDPWAKGIFIVKANRPVNLQLWILDSDGGWNGPKETTPWGEKAAFAYGDIPYWSEDNPADHAERFAFALHYTGRYPLFVWVPPGTDTKDLVLTGYLLNGDIPHNYYSNQVPLYRLQQAGKLQLYGVIEATVDDMKYYFRGDQSPYATELIQYAESYVSASPAERERMRRKYFERTKELYGTH